MNDFLGEFSYQVLDLLIVKTEECYRGWQFQMKFIECQKKERPDIISVLVHSIWIIRVF